MVSVAKNPKTPAALFELGQIVATPGAIEALEEAKQGASLFILRHSTGDWGVMGEDDAAMNDRACNRGGPGGDQKEDRVFSGYLLSDQTKIWIITEWDRSATTILLPNEY